MDHQCVEENLKAGGSGDSGNFVRQRKPKTETLCCPICGITLRPNDIDQHFALEVERLDRILKPRTNASSASASYTAVTDRASPVAGPSGNIYGTKIGGSTGITNGHSTEDTTDSAPLATPEECWGTYQKIKNNRQARLKIKTRKRKTEDSNCPVCNKVVSEDITSHVENCLKKSEINGNGVSSRVNDSDDDDVSIDVEGENFEVYEWAGHTRVRTTSMLHQTGALASTAVRVTNAEDTDDELNVDGDETQIYGPPQYSERDVIYPMADNRFKDSYLRGLVMANEPLTLKRPEQDNPGEGTSRHTVARFPQQQQQHVHMTSEDRNGENGDQIIESLKSKIREYEGFIQNRPKCLICMDDFRKPVVSICCWHVYCEECWLHTLGAKKLCPQCSMITSPTDLRRIYL
ncbi:E3 ubiquitin-protein ligase RNF220 [Wyeomyia smithii]|uniref:E3 ubiquitin-protein ligase RNF220 n=1 Tax=Wyeomyia smithii TaxID=174621 RepID=UPI002467FFBE|nr:E3 ubiquitin-protein ligase RNF220 [Wyeomyia smithii]